MTLSTGKRAELAAKLDSVDVEFACWRAESEPGQPLEKHHTQIRRITNRLAALTGHIRQELELTGDWSAVELLVLDVHQLWHFFRAKLALRYLPWLRPPLVAADELTWACYQPAQAAGTGAHTVDPAEVREPPLAFFSAADTPFAIPRGAAYAGQADTGPLHTGAFRDELRALPVPVIGVPWHQVRYLPDALVLCHEAGHHVEDDLRLTARLHALLDGALDAAGTVEGRRGAWHAWLGELFADLYGVLAAGPAFVAALVGFLAAAPSTVATERRTGPDWGGYPTTHLRALACFEALRLTCPREVRPARPAVDPDRIEAAWRSAHPVHAMPGYEDDVPAIVQALLDGPYPELGGVRLPQVLSFAALWPEAEVDTARLLAGLPAQSGNPRALIASGGLAFAADPAGYAARDVPGQVHRRILDVQETGTRFRGGGGPAAPPPDLLAAADTHAAAALFDRLRHRALRHQAQARQRATQRPTGAAGH